MTTQRVFLQNHNPIDFSFKQTKDDFKVTEISNQKFFPFNPKKGKFLVLKIKKQNLSTWELLGHISKTLNLDENLIGYAGLKDKNATTIQYISVPSYNDIVQNYTQINSKNIKVLEVFSFNRKLKIGDLEANRFKINIYDIKPEDLTFLYQTISQIQKHGLPNYFGYQRFGQESNFEKSKRISYGEEVLKDKKLEKFLKLAYQSYFFNAWLAKRVEISKGQNLKKLQSLDGDVFSLENKDIITGLLPGRGILRAKNEARVVEEQFDDMFIHEKGYRRDAWIYPKDIKNKYNNENSSMSLEFTLPKSSYATVFIENLANQNFSF